MGLPEPEEGYTQAIISTTTKDDPLKPHAIERTQWCHEDEDDDEVIRTKCGMTLGRDIRHWQLAEFQWPRIGHLVFRSKCGRDGCKNELTGLVATPMGPDTKDKDIQEDQDEQENDSDSDGSSGSSSASSPSSGSESMD